MTASLLGSQGVCRNLLSRGCFFTDKGKIQSVSSLIKGLKVDGEKVMEDESWLSCLQTGLSNGVRVYIALEIFCVFNSGQYCTSEKIFHQFDPRCNPLAMTIN